MYRILPEKMNLHATIITIMMMMITIAPIIVLILRLKMIESRKYTFYMY